MAILTSTLIVQLVLSLFWTLNPLHYLQLSVGKQGVLANNCCVLCSRIFLLNLLNMYTFFIALYYKQNDLVSVHFFLSLLQCIPYLCDRLTFDPFSFPRYCICPISGSSLCCQYCLWWEDLRGDVYDDKRLLKEREKKRRWTEKWEWLW